MSALIHITAKESVVLLRIGVEIDAIKGHKAAWVGPSRLYRQTFRIVVH